MKIHLTSFNDYAWVTVSIKLTVDQANIFCASKDYVPSLKRQSLQFVSIEQNKLSVFFYRDIAHFGKEPIVIKLTNEQLDKIYLNHAVVNPKAKTYIGKCVFELVR